MFIKRAKSRPSLRTRDADDEDSSAGATSSPLAKMSFTAHDVDDGDDAGQGGSVMERKRAQKKGRSLGKASRLSFGGEEEGGDASFKPKKSLLSQSLKAQSPAPAPSTSTPTASSQSYSREYLSELKAATPTRATREDREDVDPSTGLSRAAAEKYGLSIMEDTTAGIPDAAAIAAAKIKRQTQNEARKAGVEDDFIPLGQISIYDGEKGPHPESRLMREEDEGDDGDEDLAGYTEANDKLPLGRSANKSAALRLKGEKGELIADREEEDEDDEETREWEQTLLSRGGLGEIPSKKEEKRSQVYQPAPMPSIRPLPTISAAQQRVRKALEDLKAVKDEQEANVEIAEKDLAILDQQEKDLRRQVEEVEGKREWVEEFRGWVEMLGSFLEDKYPKLEAIEADSLSHLKERAQDANLRRANDDSDDLAMFVGAPAGQSIVEAGPSAPPRRARRAERDQRRSHRSHRPTKAAAEEGFSTDSSMDESSARDYEAAQNELEQRVHALLEDVKAEDFRDPNLGLAVRFGDWRKRYEEEYKGAFGGLALVQAWEFWARGEMVGWEPFRSSRTVESFKWFTSLHEYSDPDRDDDDMDIDPADADMDENLVAEMVNKAVVPLLTKAVEAGAYDPYSAPQTRRAVDLADVVSEQSGKDSRKFTGFLKAVLAIYHTHLLELSSSIAAVTAVDAFPPPPFDPYSRTAMQRYVRRRIKLMRNMLLWRRQASAEVGELVNRLVGEVLRPVLSRTWDGGGKEMAAQVLAASGGVLSPDLTSFLQQGPQSW